MQASTPATTRSKALTPETGAPRKSLAALKIVSPNVGPDERHIDDAPRADETLVGLDPAQRSRRILSLIKDELDANKAEDVLVIDLAGKSDIADAMVVASGRSARHVGAVADKVQRRLKGAGLDGVRSEGQPACDWVLIDAEDVIVHLFRPEVRDFYNLERIWSETAHAPTRPDA